MRIIRNVVISTSTRLATTRYVLCCTLLIGSFSYATLPAQPANNSAALNQQAILQQERQQALEQQLQPPTPTVHLLPPSADTPRHFPVETPCFAIQQIELRGQQPLPHWLQLDNITQPAQGQCLGSQGINQLMGQLQNHLIDHGYITTRVVVPPQDLRQGTLTLHIIAGSVKHLQLSQQSDSRIQLYNSVPVTVGKPLNLRDIEQGLENLQRLPTVQADIKIIPAQQQGESDIHIHWQQKRLWRLNAYVDNSGNNSTGRYQGGLTLYLDNPTSLSDMLYLSVSRDLAFVGQKGTRNYTLYYTIPLGYWGLATTASRYNYYQTVVGAQEDFVYRGNSQNLNVQLSRLLHRNTRQKTHLRYSVQLKQSRNFLNDAELLPQHRRTTAWSASLEHQHFMHTATFNMTLRYQQGTRWFGAKPAPEERFDEGTALSKIITLSGRFTQPFTLAEHRLRYTLEYQYQWSRSKLTPQDQLSIGNRWTVRGFDGERTLSADNGGYIRNELAWSPFSPRQELYFAADYGQLACPCDILLAGKSLAGVVVGLRGSLFTVSYELFAGTPLYKPKRFRTDNITLGFTLNWHY